MDISYLITPFCAWLVAGSIKFFINSICNCRLAFDLIGYGGMPSNHASITSSAVAIIIFKQGIEHPAVVVAMALAFIVMLDATSLRNQIGKHAQKINEISNNKHLKLKTTIGHKITEIFAGICAGIFSAWIIYYVLVNNCIHLETK
jgi:acid phosphatase family membrane protein YuiD